MSIQIIDICIPDVNKTSREKNWKKIYIQHKVGFVSCLLEQIGTECVMLCMSLHHTVILYRSYIEAD